MIVRTAISADAEALSSVLGELFAAGKRTKACDTDFVRSHYTDHPDQIQCSLAVDDNGQVLGFQSLILARDENPYGAPVGWGIIGTHVRPSAARRGVGSRLFAQTQKAARRAGLAEIEACIGAGNAEGLAYYKAIGFRTYRHAEGLVRKSFKVE